MDNNRLMSFFPFFLLDSNNVVKPNLRLQNFTNAKSNVHLNGSMHTTTNLLKKLKYFINF